MSSLSLDSTIHRRQAEVALSRVVSDAKTKFAGHPPIIHLEALFLIYDKRMSSLITQLTLLISWFASVHSLRFHLPSPTAATRSVGHRLPHVTSTRLREEPPIVTHSLRVVLNARNSREDEIRRKVS